MRKLINLLICTFSYAIFNTTNAETCETLHINISNFTGENCILKHQNSVSGAISTGAAPAVISPFETKSFDMIQSVTYGPRIKLTYQCGTESVDFTSQQNYCLVEAGDINGSTFDGSWLPSSGLWATYNTQSGSWSSTKGGTINWSLYQIKSHIFTLDNQTANSTLQFESARNIGTLLIKIYPDDVKQEIPPGKSAQFILRRFDSDGLNYGVAEIYFKATNKKTGIINDCYMRIIHVPIPNVFNTDLSLSVSAVNPDNWFSDLYTGNTVIDCKLEGKLTHPVLESHLKPARIIVTDKPGSA